MAGSNRRYTLAAIALPFLLVVMSGLARANTIFVNTLEGGSDATLCTLPDAIASTNSGFAVGGCFIFTGTGADQIVIGVTGTIFVDVSKLPLNISDEALEITTFGDGPVVIDGGNNHEIEGGIMFVSPLNKFLELTNLTFADGFAVSGGALFSDTGGDVDIKDCLFEDNTAANGGSAAEGGAIDQFAGRMEVTNSTFYGNSAPVNFNTLGGAIFDSHEPLKLTNVTFEHNSAANGNSISNVGGTVDVKGTIFADQLDKAGTGVVAPRGNCFGGSVTDENYNISVDDSCGFTAGSSLNNRTAAEVDLDPLGLQNNGGPSETVALESGSDAINRIPVANCTEQDSHMKPLVTDQRLFGRPDPGNLNTCDSGAYEFGALGAYTLNSDTVQIARSTAPNSDQVNMGLTFTANGDPDCDLGVGGDEDALNNGVGIGLFQGTCASLPFNGLFLDLSPFQVHTVNHQQYGTLFESAGPITVSARLVALTPPAGLCGKWTLNLEVSGLNTSSTSEDLGGTNPFAVLISDESDAESCFDVTNAIVGSQIPKPSHSVRRGVRRQTRR